MATYGGVPERPNGTVSKTVVGETPPRVRIPAPPPFLIILDRLGARLIHKATHSIMLRFPPLFSPLFLSHRPAETILRPERIQTPRKAD
jgi:hypothetical protein